MSRPDPVAELRRLIESLPEGGRGGGVELLLHQMEPGKARLLRLCAIPHEFDPEVLRTLAPELDAELARQRCAELARLAIVVGSGERLALHDEARRHLFSWWLEPGNRAELAEANRVLASRLSGQMPGAPRERLEELQDQHMFHVLGYDQAAGFAELDRLLGEARHAFRLSRCATLLRLAKEYRPLLDRQHRLWLDYQTAKLAADHRDLDAAQAGLEGVLADPQAPAELHGKALTRLGHLESSRNDWPKAIARYREALAWAEEYGLDGSIHGILCDLAAAHRDNDELSQAEDTLLWAIEAATRAGSVSGLAVCYNGLGTLHAKRGDLDQAIDAYRQSLDCLERTGQRFRTAQALNNLGMACIRRGDLDEGEEHLRASLKIKQEAGDSCGQASTLNNLVAIYRRQRRTQEALAASHEAIGLFDSLHANREAAVAYVNLGRLHRDSGRPDLARQAYEEAMVRFRACGAADEVENTRKALASLAVRRGLPWWAWGVMLLALVLVGLVAVGLLIEVPQPQYSAFSSDGRRWVIASQRAGKWSLDVDGEVQGPYDELLDGTPLFSPDGRRLAFAARQGDHWLLMLDAEPPRRHESILPGSLAFSPDGQRFAYAVRDSGAHRLIADGEAGPAFDEIFSGTVVFSPDGARLSYRVRMGAQRTLVVDGEPGRWFDLISTVPWIFSPDGRRVAYAGVRDGQSRMVVDGEEGSAYDDISVGTSVFSPDSRRIAYAGKRGAKWFLVVDGQEGRAYDDMAFGPTVFGPDSRRTVYVAWRGKRPMVVIDGEEREAFDGILKGTPLFSPDGQRIVYCALRDGKWVVVADGRQDDAWEIIFSDSLQFSPDSQRLAYAAREGGQWRLVVDGVEGVSHEDLFIGKSLFSPDGRHLAYGARDGDEWHLVVDSETRGRFDEILTLTFVADNRVRALVRADSGIRAIEEPIHP